MERSSMLVPYLLLACSSAAPPGGDTADAGADATTVPDAPPTDAPPADAPVDVPRPADANPMRAYCDDAQLAIVRGAGATPTVLVLGRVLSGVGAAPAAVAESVDILLEGRVVQSVAGVGAFRPGTSGAVVARGDADPSLAARCAVESNRFSGIGFVVRGTADGAPFVARCGAAEGIGRWPPSGYLSCHEGVEEPGRNGIAEALRMGMFTFTSLTAFLPEGANGPAMALDPSVLLIPQRAPSSPGGPLAPRTVAGWMSSVGRSTTGMMPASQLSLAQQGDPLGELCTAPSMPGPMPVQGPAFLARFTGRTARGPFRTEVLFGSCTRSGM